MNPDELRKLIQQATGASANSFWMSTNRKPCDVIVELATHLLQLQDPNASRILASRGVPLSEAAKHAVRLMMRNSGLVMRSRAKKWSVVWRESGAICLDLHHHTAAAIVKKGLVRQSGTAGEHPWQEVFYRVQPDIAGPFLAEVN